MVKGKKYGKIPGQSWNALFIMWVVFGINANGREILNRTMPSIVDTFNITATTAGMLSTGVNLALGIGALPLSAWADRGSTGWGRKKRSLIIAIGYMLPTFLCGFNGISATFAVFAVFQIAKGLFSAAGEAVEVGQVAEWWPREKAGFALGAHHTSFPWGTLLGGLLATAVLGTFGPENWRILYIIFPALGVVAWIVWWMYANNDRYMKFHNNAIDSGYTTPLDVENDQDASVNNVPPGALGRALRNPNVSMMIVLGFCCLFGYVGINFWLTPYIAFVADYSYAAAASLSLVFTITGGLGQIIWGDLADRFGTKRCTLICTGWLAVSFWLMQFVYLGLWALILFQLLLGCCANAVYALIYRYIAVSCEKGTVVTGNGLSLAGMYIGGAIATMVLGWLIDLGGGWSSASGYYTGLYVIAGVMVVAFLVTLLFTRETNGPRFRKDFALVSLKSCNLEGEENEV